MTSCIPDWQVAAEAADWVTRIDAGPLMADEKAALAQWLRRSPVHVDELLFSASIMAGLAQVDGDKSRSIDDLLIAMEPDVIPLFHGQDMAPETSDAVRPESAGDDGKAGYFEEEEEEEVPQNGKITRYWPALAASLLLALAASWYHSSSTAPVEASVVISGAKVFASGDSEPRSVVLEDGSVIYLNANSRARVAFSDSRRLIELVDGEALFDVAHDRTRPFRVLAAGTITEAVGTRFTVKRENGTVTVAVMEGEVLVGSRRDVAPVAETNSIVDSVMRGEPIRLAAGHTAQLWEKGTKNTAVAVTRLAGAASWQNRQLSFNDEGLSVIATEFNRFNALKIVIADGDLARTRFSGVFDAHDPESFIAFLELSAGVRVDRSNNNQVVLTATDPGA